MNLLSLIWLSSSLSVVTLVIQLWQPKQVKSFWLPAWIFGTSRPHKVIPKLHHWAPPPWFQWLLTLCITLGAGLAYYQPPLAEQRSGFSGKRALVWIDTTFSTVARFEKENKILSDSVMEVFEAHWNRYSDWGLLKDATLPPGAVPAPPWVRSHPHIVTLTSPSQAHQATREAWESLGGPVAGHQPLNIGRVQEALGAGHWNPEDTELFVVGDGQRSTIQRLLTDLGPLFKGHIVFPKIAPLRTPLTQWESHPLAPPELVQAWAHDNPPQSPPHAALPPVWHIRVPQRPKSQWINAKEPLEPRFVASISETDSPTTQRATPFAGVFACDFPGAEATADLNPLGDALVVARQWPLHWVPLNLCHPSEGAETTRLAVGKWQWGRPWVWLTPATEAFFKELEAGTLTPPEGLDLTRGDAWVVLANGPAVPGFDGSAPNWGPSLPARTLSFSLPGHTLPNQPPKTYTFKPINSLFYQAESSLIFYLKTPASSPLQSLSRNPQWVQFWTDLFQNPMNNLGYGRHMVIDPDKPLAVQIPPLPHWLTQAPAPHWEPLGSWKVLGHNVSPPSADPHAAFKGLYSLYQFNFNDQNYTFTYKLSAQEFDPTFMGVEGPGGAAETDTQKSSAPFQKSSWINRMGALLALGACALLWGWIPARTAKRRTQALLKSRERRSLARWGLLVFAGTYSLAAAGAAAPSPKETVSLAWCEALLPPGASERYLRLKSKVEQLGTLELPDSLEAGQCRPGGKSIWWSDTLQSLPKITDISRHLSLGGAIVLEGMNTTENPPEWFQSPSTGRIWVPAGGRSLLHRSFFLLQSLDGCPSESSQLLLSSRRPGSKNVMGLWTQARFFSEGTESDCWKSFDDLRNKTFVNLMYALFTQDYKEDQMHMPEILNRVRHMGLEP